MAPVKLRTIRSHRSPADDTAVYERPDDLYALFAHAEPPADVNLTPPTACINSAASDSSVIERLTAWEHTPASAPPARRASDADLQRAAAASRLAALVVRRRRRLTDERVSASIRFEVSPPPVHADAPTSAATEPARAAPQTEPLINVVPLPPAIAPDSAHLALTALRMAGRLVPLLLPAPATRIDPGDVVRMLSHNNAHALSAWIDAWSRRPVVQFFRSSGTPVFDATVLQYLLADSFAIALASDVALAHDVERMLRAAEAPL